MLRQFAAPEDFDPRHLAREFTPALVTEFEAETVLDDNFVDHTVRAYGQYHDLCIGYAYGIQVLDEIRRVGVKAITGKMVLRWIKESHRLLAHHLLAGSPNNAGEYNDNVATRWHWGVKAEKYVSLYLGGAGSATDIAKLAKADGYPADKFQNVMAMLNKLRGFKINEAHYRDVLGTELQDSIMERGRYRLAIALYTDFLTSEEKSYLSDVVTACMKPEQIPAAMETFCDQLALKWRTCDGGNQEQLGNLLHFSFLHLSGLIHPFANGNGRESTWLVNVIARSFNRPSFLMRRPNDRANPESSYRVVLATMQTHPENFKRHVFQQMELKPEVEEGECQLVVENVRNLLLIKDYQKRYHANVITPALDRAFGSSVAANIRKYGENCYSTHDMQLKIQCVRSEHALLLEIPSIINTAAPAAVVSPVVCKEYTDTEISKITAALRKITGTDGWKFCRMKDGQKWLLEFNHGEDELITKTKDTLTRTESMKLDRKRITTTKKSILLVSEVNLPKLLKQAGDLQVEPSKKPVW